MSCCRKVLVGLAVAGFVALRGPYDGDSNDLSEAEMAYLVGGCECYSVSSDPDCMVAGGCYVLVAPDSPSCEGGSCAQNNGTGKASSTYCEVVQSGETLCHWKYTATKCTELYQCDICTWEMVEGICVIKSCSNCNQHLPQYDVSEKEAWIDDNSEPCP